MSNNKVFPAADKAVHLAAGEEPKTKHDLSSGHEKKQSKETLPKKKSWLIKGAPTIAHYFVLFILGLLVWGTMWFSFGAGWNWNGAWFRVIIVVVAAWASGLVLHSLTGLPSLLGNLLIGILATNVGYLDMRNFNDVDSYLRKIYPVVILGKGSLGWDTNFMKQNWKKIAALGALPWSAEVATLTICTYFFLGHPWTWGVAFGSFFASVTGPVVILNVLRVGMSPRRTQNWPQLVATSGGTDTALSVGVYGAAYTFLFGAAEISDLYRYFRAFSAIFIGACVGIGWGTLAAYVPHTHDMYVVELRVLFVLFGGLFLNFATTYIKWGGIAGVAVLACNATAARSWAKQGWTLNNNPASTAYRVLWSACEPAVFAYTGTFFVFNNPKIQVVQTILYGLGILLICMTVRLSVATLVCWKIWRLQFKERIFMCCVWSTKTIVEAVLCPTFINMLLLRGTGTAEEMRYAEEIVYITVIEILVTTPAAFLLTRYLGPKLIRDKEFSDESFEHATESKA